MQTLTAGTLAELVGGTLIGDPATIIGPDVVIDSREITNGALFVALPGERVDGHTFVAGALAKGAGAALIRSDRAEEFSSTAGSLVTVTDVVAALGRLGRFVVDEAAEGGLQVVGITGSMGKTSTKDLLSRILTDRAPTVSPVNSFNNEIGVPLTATRIGSDTGYLVSEMGARGLGHIALLCELTPPAVGVVLNVAHAHLGGFGSQDRIAEAKGELVAALPADGIAVLNADDPRVRAMTDRGPARVLLFADGQRPGFEPGFPFLGAVWATDVTPDRWGRHTFTLATEVATISHRATVRLTVPGRHQVINAVAAAAAGVALGLAPEQIAASLDGAGLDSRWRMELTERADGTVIVNDAYNANPEAVHAALDTVAEMARTNNRRMGVVLADMLELGEAAAEDHREVGVRLAARSVDWAVLLGDHGDDVASGAHRGGLSGAAMAVVHDKQEAVQAVLARIRPGDVVLIKGSRGMALETVAEQLTREDPA
ncbi:MAG: UDP-N-acetylmuramoyl-tripeptide--D-alanyl-D-alanine ligase [Propionibacteriales bacterium]|nr:UDP-N-acetylmuramoyl-tripeptide--D-alanyl-D-alanine ligase [Propionibacteriales bacterium]